VWGRLGLARPADNWPSRIRGAVLTNEEYIARAIFI
jgi:hypothetical protein